MLCREGLGKLSKLDWHRHLADLAKGIAIALVLGLFARYEAIDNQHKVLNGLPLAFVIQEISISRGELVSVSLDSLGLVTDILFWTLFVYVVDRIRKTGRPQSHQTKAAVT